MNVGLLNYIFQDAPGVYGNCSRLACFVRYFINRPFRVTVRFRYAQYFVLKHKNWLYTKWVSYRYENWAVKTGVNLQPETKIGRGLLLLHAFSIYCTPYAKIGKYCMLFPQAHIGTSRTKAEGDGPVIGDYCFIGNGCHIIGNCKIGDWCFISPGAFVCKDIPSGSVVGFGINNILSDKGKENRERYLMKDYNYD